MPKYVKLNATSAKIPSKPLTRKLSPFLSPKNTPKPNQNVNFQFQKALLNQIDRLYLKQRSIAANFNACALIKMADADSLEYYVKFPSPGFTGGSHHRLGDAEYVFVVDEDQVPVVLLFGWAGCQDKYLSKYSKIYEEKGLITLRYTAPLKCLFWKRMQMFAIGEKLVKLLIDLNFEKHPIIVHCFSNGGAFLYQHFVMALDKSRKPFEVKGVIFDSAPGKRRIITLYRAVSEIMGGKWYYNVPMSLVMTMFLSMMWFVEVISSVFNPSRTFQSNPFDHLMYDKRQCPQLYIYSKADHLIPYTDIEYFSTQRRKMGVEVTNLCFESSPHVKHYTDNRELYTNTIYSFLGRCLNGGT